jgi:hypothetical protein
MNRKEKKRENIPVPVQYSVHSKYVELFLLLFSKINKKKGFLNQRERERLMLSKTRDKNIHTLSSCTSKVSMLASNLSWLVHNII